MLDRMTEPKMVPIEDLTSELMDLRRAAIRLAARYLIGTDSEIEGRRTPASLAAAPGERRIADALAELADALAELADALAELGGVGGSISYSRAYLALAELADARRAAASSSSDCSPDAYGAG